jgi:hypothetical protein
MTGAEFRGDDSFNRPMNRRVYPVAEQHPLKVIAVPDPHRKSQRDDFRQQIPKKAKAVQLLTQDSVIAPPAACNFGIIKTMVQERPCEFAHRKAAERSLCL